MYNLPYSPKEKPEFDCRVKQLFQIEAWIALLTKILGLLIVGFFLMGLLGIVKAANTDDLFMVPEVKAVPGGAKVIQSPINDNNTNIPNYQTFNNYNSFTPPVYDAFAEDSMSRKIQLPEAKISNIDQVNFSISNNMTGSSEREVGTTQTIFSFIADIQANSLQNNYNGDFEYRWDFENDGQMEEFFSFSPTAHHQFKKAGNYNVKLEVLDKAGRVYQAIKTIKIVNNDAPKAIFSVNKIVGAIDSIFSFDTALSNDNQYNKAQLIYRFDWDNDGQFDTNFQNKTVWNHLYKKPGHYTVLMEVKDPEGASAKASLDLDVESNQAPIAQIKVLQFNQNGQIKIVYQFDAANSSDDHTALEKLRFRWDFNFNGQNDIVFDTSWSNSPKYSGSYNLGGNKTVRLQVMDEQGKVSEAYAKLTINR